MPVPGKARAVSPIAADPGVLVDTDHAEGRHQVGPTDARRASFCNPMTLVQDTLRSAGATGWSQDTSRRGAPGDPPIPSIVRRTKSTRDFARTAHRPR